MALFGEDSILGLIFNPILKWLRTRNAIYAIVGTVILVVAMGFLFSYQADAFPAADPYNYLPPVPDYTTPPDAMDETLTITGYANEGTSIEEPFDLLGDRIWAVEVSLTWQDTGSNRPRFTNMADTFEMSVSFPDGTESRTISDSATSSATTITLGFNLSEGGGADWSETPEGNSITVNVQCTNAGDLEPFFSPLNFRTIADDGNDYTLSVYYIYTETE